ncbi:ABC transporter ATP-binding protein [Beggiatoa alba]|nr:ABC transporter ATP-binding protein [bacterium AH-315-E07]MBN4081882.1 ABC transporter ATP-binding protein [Beggiatoa alba]
MDAKVIPQATAQQADVLLRVNNLKTQFSTSRGALRAVDGVSFEVRKGETFALLGESGCGKSMTALSIMRLVPQPAGHIVDGSVHLGDTDLLQLSEADMRATRGGRIAMIFQEPQSSLNPVLTVGEQIIESVLCHTPLKRAQAKTRVLELLDAVGIPDPKRRYKEYPHQLSGGMKQRVMIAIALAGEPELLIADEPTTALDVTIQAQVLSLLSDLQKQTGMAMLFITHDLGVVSDIADRIAVMYAGQVVEQAGRDEFFGSPRHPYTCKLFESVPRANKRDESLAVIEGSVPSLLTHFSGCRFADRCDYAWDTCRHTIPRWLGDEEYGVRCHRFDDDVEQVVHQRVEKTVVAQVKVKPGDNILIKVDDLKVHFPIQKGLLKRTVGQVKAVDGVSLEIAEGHTLALVGESGCGKTTVGKGILQLLTPTSGRVEFDGYELTTLDKKTMRGLRSEIQVIFQDPYSSMNPRMMVKDIIAEGMIAQNTVATRGERDRRIDELLDQVGLAADSKQRYPHEFSGGQRQRICIARALAVNPKLIICDEPTSALDVSVQAQILNLLKELQRSHGLAYLFITHNLSVVEYLAHDVAVMYLGRIVEYGPVDMVFAKPAHPYTEALLSAAPTLDDENKREMIRLEGDLPSPAAPPVGCHFNPRCPKVMDECRLTYPKKVNLNKQHHVRCHLYV